MWLFLMLECRALPGSSQSISSFNQCLLSPYSVPGSVSHPGGQWGTRQTRVGCQGTHPLEERVVVSVTQPCPTLCDPVDCSLPGSSTHGIL